MRTFLRFVIGTACASPLLAGATTYTWTGLGTTNNWQEAINWSPSTGFAGISPLDIAVLPAASQNYTPVIGAPVTLTTMQVDSQAYVVSVQANTIVLGGITGSQPATLSVTNAGNLTFGNFASAGSALIAVAAQGRLNFQNSGSAGTATMTVSGTLKFLSTSTGGNAHVTLLSGTLDASSQTVSLSVGSVSDTAAQPGSIVLGNTALSLGNLNLNDTIYGTVSGNGSLTKVGTGTLSLKADNTYTGTTTVHNGVLDIQGSQTGTFTVDAASTLAYSNTASAGTSTISVGGTLKFSNASTASNAQVHLAGGLLDVSGRTTALSVGSVSDTAAQPGSIVLGNTALSLGNLNLNDTIYGTVSGNGSLSKVGTGTLILRGSNTSLGTTTVQSGTLDVENFLSGNVSVQSNATLGGGGEVGAVSNAGTLSPGGGSDHLTLSDLHCTVGSTVAFSLDTTAYLHFTNALQASACPLLDVTVQTSQSPIIGAEYMLASLDSGSDFTAVNVNAHLAGAVTRVYVEDHALILQVYSADDYIFADGFGH